MRAQDLKPFCSGAGAFVLVVPGSRVYQIGAEEACALEKWRERGIVGEALLPLVESLSRTRRDAMVPALPPVTAFSLNLAQICNMRCGYCYADHGRFGGDTANMSEETARLAIDGLVEMVPAGQTVMLGFMGGEPLIHRDLLRKTVRYAEERCRENAHPVRFSLTTNGTLVREDDARFFAEHSFHVTISVDGNASHHDRLRILHGGAGTYESVKRAVEFCRASGWPRHLAGRSTLTPLSPRVVEIVDHLLDLGFDSAGVSPVVASPRPELAFREDQFETLADQMIEVGEKAKSGFEAGTRYRFSNFTSALAEIHRGACRFLPCGAAAGYLSVAADGRLYACHRMIANERFQMGDLAGGISDQARRAFLEPRHVDRVEPCRSCWARYLCGGGCHHEVSAAGRPACNYIRRWLEFCLRAYSELAATPAAFPDFGDEPVTQAWSVS